MKHRTFHKKDHGDLGVLTRAIDENWIAQERPDLMSLYASPKIQEGRLSASRRSVDYVAPVSLSLKEGKRVTYDGSSLKRRGSFAGSEASLTIEKESAAMDLGVSVSELDIVTSMQAWDWSRSAKDIPLMRSPERPSSSMSILLREVANRRQQEKLDQHAKQRAAVMRRQAKKDKEFPGNLHM